MPGKKSDGYMFFVNGNKTKPKLRRMLFSVTPETGTTDRISKCTCLCSLLSPRKETTKCYIKVLSVLEEQHHRKLVFRRMLELLPRFLACLEGGFTLTLS